MKSIHSLNRNLQKLLILLSAIFIFSCSESKLNGSISEGVIEYKITYPTIEEGSYLLDLMPKKMETTFSKNNFRSDVVAGMGLFKTSIICKEGDSDFIHSVKMLSKKIASTLNHEQLKAFNPNFQNLKITVIDEIAEIAGLPCKAVQVEVLGDSSWGFKAFYTEKIIIKNSTKHTPFNKINGVLMQYEIISYKTHMKFTATKVTETEVDLKDIELEDGYIMVEPKELKAEIEAIFEKVK